MGRIDPRDSETVLESVTVDLRVLGTFEATEKRPDGTGRAIDLGGRRQRTVLALLLVRAGATPVDTLIDELWGENPPATARHALHVYLSELRKNLPGLIQSTPLGYVCQVDATNFDSLRYESMVGAADAIVLADPAGAVEFYLEAETLWRGEPYEGVEDREAVSAEARRLIEVRLIAMESRFRAQVSLGRNAAIVGELATTCEQHPFREEFRALHMMALYRSGRQAEALRAFQATRRTLGEELGIEPSPALRRLEEQILVQDPTLEPEPAPIDDHNPYPGLPPFTETHAADFHGRQYLVDQLIESVDRHGVVALVGPSGSGKTSVVRAGLIPQLGDGWRVAYTNVGADPFESTERALRSDTEHPEIRSTPDATLSQIATVVGDQRLLLVIDQFEELFTLVTAEHVRQHFLDQLLGLAEMPGVTVLVSLRADFYDRPLAYPAFGRALTAGHITVMPLAPEELEEAAVLPARRMGVSFDPGVLGALFSDLAGQPSALPLFSHTLSELYERRSGNRVTVDAYRALGGVRHALAQRAETQYATLDQGQQAAARRLFLRLVTLTDQGPARRLLPAAEIDDIETDLVEMQAAIEAFTRHRLLTLDRDPTTGSPIIDLAHEALLTEWGRLAEWIENAHDDIRTLSALDAAVIEWQSEHEDAAYLATGSRVDRYLVLSDTLGLTTQQRRYVAASANERHQAETAQQADRRERARMQRRLNLMGAGVAVLVLAATAVALVLFAPDLFAEPPRILLTVAELGDPQISSAVQQGIDLGMDVVRHRYNPNDEAAMARVIASESPDYVFVDPRTAGLEYVAQAVRDNPDIRFSVVDPRFNPPEGVDRVVLALEEAGFIAGAAAASATETGVVAMIGGLYPSATERWRAGFEAGATAVDRKVEILTTLLLHTTETQTATALFALNADVLLVEEQTWVLPILRIAADVTAETGVHRWVIGGGQDADRVVPDNLRPYLLASATTDVAAVYVDLMAQYGEGEWEPGTSIMGIDDGYIRLGEGRIDPAHRDSVNSLVDAVVTGEIRIPTVPRLPSTPLPVGTEAGTADPSTNLPGDSGVRKPTITAADPPSNHRLDFLLPGLCSDVSCLLSPAFVDEFGLTTDESPAGDPFHVRHGFINTGGRPYPSTFDVELIVTRMRGPWLLTGDFLENRSYTFRSDYGLVEETDRCGPGYFTQTDVQPCEMYVHDFPEGLPPGAYLITATWVAPCHAWTDLGFERRCDDPNDAVAGFESGAFIRVYSESDPKWLPIDEGIDVPLPDDFFG